ncbi:MULTISPECIES: hypothetical protein [Cupriavidus]
MTRTARPFRLICLTAALSAALSLPAAAFAQGSPATGDEAINAINSNFARMTPAPRTVDSINQELRQNHAAPVSGGTGMRGRGRGRQRSQDSTADGAANGASSGANNGASQDGGGLHTSLPGTSGSGAAPAATQ